MLQWLRALSSDAALNQFDKEKLIMNSGHFEPFRRVRREIFTLVLCVLSGFASAECTAPQNNVYGTTQTCYSAPNNALNAIDGSLYIELENALPTVCSLQSPAGYGAAQVFFRVSPSNPSIGRISAAAEMTLAFNISLALIVRSDQNGHCEVLSTYHGRPGL